MVNLGFPSIGSIVIPYSYIYIKLVEITNMNSMMWLDANELQTNINEKKKKTFDTLNHDHKGLGVDHDFSSTTNPWSHIIGNQDHQKMKKKIKTLREREK